MKALDQVEPRTPIDAAHTPGDNTYEVIINTSGSYYLTGDLRVTKPNGIRINAADVTIDLGGFSILRNGGTGGNGIEIPDAANGLVVQNGFIRGFGNGTACPDGVASTQSVRGGAFFRVGVSACAGAGLQGGVGWRLEHCNAHDNGGNGISSGNSSTLNDCTAINNTGIGFFVTSGCHLAACAARGNLGTAGISAGPGSSVVHCNANGNSNVSANSTAITCSGRGLIISCSVTDNGYASGINATDDSTVLDNNLSNNGGDGIRASSNCIIRGNHITISGAFGSDGAGIHVTGSRNRIENNDVTLGDRGIEIGGAANLIIKNSAGNNGTTNNLNYVIAADNHYGPIINITANGTAAVNGNAAPDTTTTTHPWANFSY
jgi:parallel beta-helix repeat protein